MVALSLKIPSLGPCLFKLLYPPPAKDTARRVRVYRCSWGGGFTPFSSWITHCHHCTLSPCVHPRVRMQLQDLSNLLWWTCLPKASLQQPGAAGPWVCWSPTFPPFSHLGAVWGVAVLCGPLAFLQRFCWPSLWVFWQDFVVGEFDDQSPNQWLPLVSRAWHMNPCSSEKSHGLGTKPFCHAEWSQNTF